MSLSRLEVAYRAHLSSERQVDALSWVHTLIDTGAKKPTLIDTIHQLKDPEQTSQQAIDFLKNQLSSAMNAVSTHHYQIQIDSLKEFEMWDFRHRKLVTMANNLTRLRGLKQQADKKLHPLQQQLVDLQGRRAVMESEYKEANRKLFDSDESDDEPNAKRYKPATGGISKWYIRMNQLNEAMDNIDEDITAAKKAVEEQEDKCRQANEDFQHQEQWLQDETDKLAALRTEIDGLEETRIKLDTPEYKKQYDILRWVNRKLALIRDLRSVEKDLHQMEKEEQCD